jgi:sucrose-6-phosphate hydrolase SacC (GH32 family)
MRCTASRKFSIAGLIALGCRKYQVEPCDCQNKTFQIKIQIQSGDASFAEHFAGRQSGPVTIGPGGVVRLHIFLDRSSVEVFADSGGTVLAELIFPVAGEATELHSKGGQARIRKLDIWS